MKPSAFRPRQRQRVKAGGKGKMPSRQTAGRTHHGQLAAVLAVLVFLGVTGCRRQSLAPPPGDPMLTAIRGDERAAGLTHAEAQGRLLFLQYCATCHGDEGKGDGQNASNLNPKPPDLTASKSASDAALLRRVIAQGSAAVGRSPLSPPWGRLLRPQQIDDLVLYCRVLGRKKTG
jgi:mono/diheme cytochrome c family protein